VVLEPGPPDDVGALAIAEDQAAEEFRGLEPVDPSPP
jgi:hypothetical protein